MSQPHPPAVHTAPTSTTSQDSSNARLRRAFGNASLQQYTSNQNLFLWPATRRCDLAGSHQVANVLLQKFVVVVQFVMLFSDRLNTVEDGD